MRRAGQLARCWWPWSSERHQLSRVSVEAVALAEGVVSTAGVGFSGGVSTDGGFAFFTASVAAASTDWEVVVSTD